jgi:Double zinc ribbon
LALSTDEKLILLIILVIVMSVVMFFEMRFIRSKSKEVRRVSQKRDEAFNDILTTRSVMNSLANRGRSVGNAPILVERAKGALDRGNFDQCVDLCAKARKELTKPSQDPIDVTDSVSEDPAESLQKVAENILSDRMPAQDPDSYKGTKLNSAKDGNYLGAKFEISAARADMSRAAKGGTDTSEAERLMRQSDSAFASGDYDKALSFAVRARRTLDGGSSSEGIRLRTVAEEQEENAIPEAGVYDVEEEKTPSGFKCSNCGKLIDPTDMFCGNCGARTSPERSCSNCGAKAKPEDTFCRKCGERV